MKCTKILEARKKMLLLVGSSSLRGAAGVVLSLVGKAEQVTLPRTPVR